MLSTLSSYPCTINPPSGLWLQSKISRFQKKEGGRSSEPLNQASIPALGHADRLPLGRPSQSHSRPPRSPIRTSRQRQVSALAARCGGGGGGEGDDDPGGGGGDGDGAAGGRDGSRRVAPSVVAAMVVVVSVVVVVMLEVVVVLVAVCLRSFGADCCM